jgi:hypothetical protein
MDVMLTAHTEATIERIKEHLVVLAPQDTTTLNYSTHPMTEGLGPVNHLFWTAMNFDIICGIVVLPVPQKKTLMD